jgi:hypothetical protein
MMRGDSSELGLSTIERVKCKACGTKYAADAQACPACGAKARISGQPSAAKTSPRPEPYHLDSEALLAKINALDWDDPTIQPAATTPPPMPPPPQRTSLWLPFVAGFAVLIFGAGALHYYSRPKPAAMTATVVDTAPADVVAAVASAPPAAVVPAEAQPSEPVPEEAAAEESEEELRARKAAARKAWREKQRKALAAKQAREEQARRERAEQERLRAERLAAEARAAAAAAAAAKPTSPRQLCAGEQNVFNRSACESRVCAEAEWRQHPFCVKRWKNELRKLSPGGFGG